MPIFDMENYFKNIETIEVVVDVPYREIKGETDTELIQSDTDEPKTIHENS